MAKPATQNDTKQSIDPSPKLTSSLPENSKTKNKNATTSITTKARNGSTTIDYKFETDIITFTGAFYCSKDLGYTPNCVIPWA